ncbi:MAG TPA: DUF790 family protein [Tepidisphaeraceae bacterium]|nr:DUF790 family protein [Tepidisphaeraceae bacterium]
MLRGEHSIVIFDSGRAAPDRLTRARHAHYLQYAHRMLAAYRAGIGRTRRELHRAVENIFSHEPDCDPRRVAAFSKLLDEAGEYDRDEGGTAAELRLKVFTSAARYHPLVTAADRIFERTESEVKQLIAAEQGQPWSEIEPALYADVLDFQRLMAFNGYLDEQALLSRYNVAQLQACLYKAQAVAVHARSDFKTVLRYAKLARLLHEISRIGASEYRIDFSGPASLLHETRRYGVGFARFIPALLACRDWDLQARMLTPWGRPAVLALSSEDGYTSHLPAPGEFDSSIEESFARNFGDERDGWRLIREAVILHEGQTTFIPDFTFRRADGLEVHLEIVGFWTAEYLEAKRKTVRLFKGRNILLAVAQRSVKQGAAIPQDVIIYKTALKVEPVLEALARWVC